MKPLTTECSHRKTKRDWFRGRYVKRCVVCLKRVGEKKVKTVTSDEQAAVDEAVLKELAGG